MESNNKKGGRPRKFDEDMLLEAVKDYVRKNKSNVGILKITKIANYFKSLGINVNYQDLKRYKKVNDYIENYNQIYKKLIFGEGSISIDEDTDMPIYSRVDIKAFLEKNKTPKDIEKAIGLLNTSYERLTESHGKMQEKMILQSEKIIQQQQQVEELKKVYKEEKSNLNEQISKLKKELYEVKEKYRITKKQMFFYDEFIRRYHYDDISEYALFLEGRIKGDMVNTSPILDIEAYQKGRYNLKDAIKKFQDILTSVNNSVETENNKEVAIDDIFHNITLLESGDNTEEFNLQYINNTDDLSLDDMENSLSRIWSDN